VYSAIHVGIRWKIQDRRQIKNTGTLQKLNSKHNPEKANNAKYSKTKLAWFSRLLRQSARKRGELILQRCRVHTGQAHSEACRKTSEIHDNVGTTKVHYWMQYYDVITNPRCQTAANMKIACRHTAYLS